jgi:phosphomannomutase
VVLARDSRTSGPLLARAVSAALEGVGCRVIDVGLVPTPTALLAIRHHEAAGGVMVTASHNPVEWNALKLASAQAMFLDADEAAAMRAYLDRPIPWQAWDGIGRLEWTRMRPAGTSTAVLACRTWTWKALRRRRFTVALDCIRGAGAVTLPILLEELGCEVHGINLEPDGRFPRRPSRWRENLGDLEALVRETAPTSGWPRIRTATACPWSTRPAGPWARTTRWRWPRGWSSGTGPGAVVTNLSTSRVVEDVAVRRGCPVPPGPVGEINVARRMQSEGAVIGGEGNGGVILPDIQLTRDAHVAAALTLQLLLETGRSRASWWRTRPCYSIVKASVPRPAGDLEGGLRPARGRAGRRGGGPAGRTLARLALGAEVAAFPAVGTEPIVRMIAEAPEEADARGLVEAARAQHSNGWNRSRPCVGLWDTSASGRSHPSWSRACVASSTAGMTRPASPSPTTAGW